MNGGFRFCGTDISVLGLEYVPDMKDTYVYAGTQTQVSQEVFEGHDGGYYYGMTKQPKEFTLRCIFQDKEITKGTIARIDGFFRRGRTGRLVFDTMRWLWYTATVINVDVSQLTNRKNGFITITMRAYYPFARHDYLWIAKDNMFDTYILENSGLLTKEQTPITTFENMTGHHEILLYNPGSERADVAIQLAGDAGEGVLITNKTTEQKCRMMAFNKAKTSEAGKTIICDSLNGKVVLTNGNEAERAFQYHDYGFLSLEPAFPILRSVGIKTEAGSKTAKVMTEEVTDSLIGKYAYVDGCWIKIARITALNEIVLYEAALTTAAVNTNIVTMNEITVDVGAGGELTTLEFQYKPTFA